MGRGGKMKFNLKISKDIKTFKHFLHSYTEEKQPTIKLLLLNIILEQFRKEA